MNGLKVETWEQWETLNCYMMSDIVLTHTGQNVRYQTYGGRGQNQYGIDLVPCNSSLPVVGQSKMREASIFTWRNVEQELIKTDAYSNPIARYFIFTTSPKHTSIQDMQNRGPYKHTRPNGSIFSVHIKYWDDYQDLSFIPQQVLQDLFPAIQRQFTSTAAIPSISPEFVSSLEKLRTSIPTLFPMDLIFWLENWDYSQGYVPDSQYDRLYELYLEFSRVEAAYRSGNEGLLLEGNRFHILNCLPAGLRLFQALANFVGLVHADSSGDNLNDGSCVQSLRGIPESVWPRITRNWSSAALELVSIYRSDVLGQPQS
ncbi:hypothetical protein EHLJMEHL_02177 [Vreelandella titanicae]